MIGTVVLASMTGLPNVLAPVRLVLRGHGLAVVSESFNSNTVNLLVGITPPALIAGIAAPAGSTELTGWWLVGITALTVVSPATGAACGGGKGSSWWHLTWSS